jgi:hypothetical protein
MWVQEAYDLIYDPNTICVACISHGKDSLAMLRAIKLLGLPLHRIVTSDVWATQDIPADLPPMWEWKKEADQIIKDIYGIDVEHICATKKDNSQTVNQSVGQLRLLRKNHPDLWALLLKWDLDSPVSFKPDGRTVHDFDERFSLEDQGLISPDDPWKWGYIADKPLQLKMRF